jgi:hypothetical protein
MTMPSTEPLLFTMELNGTGVTQVSKWPSGNCQYLTQEKELVMFTTTDGVTYKYNTSDPLSDSIVINTTSVGNTTGGITTVAPSNLLLYTAGREIRFNYLDALFGTVSDPAVDALWTNTMGNSTSSIISLNGAVVVGTDAGLELYFAPYSDTGTQTVARTILTTNPNVKGMATDAATKQLVNFLLIFVMVGLLIMIL